MIRAGIRDVIAEILAPGPQVSDRFRPRARALLAVAVATLAIAWLAGEGLERHLMSALAATLAFAAIILRAAGLWRDWRIKVGAGRLLGAVERDPAPCFVTDAEGSVVASNPAALALCDAGGERTMLWVVGTYFAHPAAVLLRLQRRAATGSAAQEVVRTGQGAVRLSVHGAAAGLFLWRFDTIEGFPGPEPDALLSGLPTLIVDGSGAIVAANDALRRLVGLSAQRIGDLFRTLPKHDGDLVVVKALDGPLPVIVAEIRNEGGRRVLCLFPAAALAAQGLAAEVETLPVALMRLSADGRIHAANRAARHLLGLSAGIEANLAERVEGLGRSIADWLADTLSGRSPGRAEVLRLREGREDAFVQIALHRAEDGVGLIAVLTDATAMKTLEAKFVQSQKMQAIGQLAGGVAHDFNNLLTAIAGHCDLLLLRHDRADPDYADLMQISQNTNRAASLVGQLLAFSRKQTLKPERIDLADVLGDMTHLLGRLVGARVQLELDCADGVGPVRADRRQLEQVLMNLIVNARDAMPGGGRVRLTVRPCVLSRQLERDRACVPAGEYALIEVSDTGTGISPDRLEKIFEPFYTTKRPGEGTGLGLSTAYGIIKQTSGFIFVDSIPGEGATFSIYLPVNRSIELPAASTDPAFTTTGAADAARPGQGVVLLVDDEAPVRAFAARALKLRGFAVLEADSAETALRLLEDSAIRVDVFVTDVIMPGLDGPTWVRRALADRPGVRVVFISGYAEEGFLAEQSQIANSVFLAKPFSLDALVRAAQGRPH
jgi:two-component system cell cycle sensor histidine kinase/response regulator CckA